MINTIGIVRIINIVPPSGFSYYWDKSSQYYEKKVTNPTSDNPKIWVLVTRGVIVYPKQGIAIEQAIMVNIPIAIV